MPASDPRAPLVGKPFQRCRYDPARAEQELAAAGWRKDTSGRLRNEAGQQVQVPIRATVASSKEMSIVAQAWRDLGIDVGQNLAGVRKGIRALTDDFGGAYLGGPSVISGNAYLWNRD